MIYIFYVFAALLVIQGIASLIEGIRFRDLVSRSLKQPSASFTPKAAIIAPCKGIDTEFEQNLSALFDQDYPDYEIIFVVAAAKDPARPFIDRAIKSNPHRAARLVIGGTREGVSEKVNNLICALEHISRDTQALVFVDSDARARAGWLRSLVAPLANRAVGATTGYRWYLPAKGGFWSALLSAWNGAVATTLGDGRRNFLWGGSTAILRETFEKLDVCKRWQHAVSDDYVLTRAVQDAGLKIEFVPRCLLVSREDASFASLLEFTTRQIIITRVYRPSVWWTGLISYLLFTIIFWGGIGFMMINLFKGEINIMPLVLISVVYALGSMKGALRLVAAREALPAVSKEIARLWWMFCLLWPLISLIFLFNFLKSTTTRRINWRGVCYEMRSPSETIIIKMKNENRYRRSL